MARRSRARRILSSVLAGGAALMVIAGCAGGVGSKDALEVTMSSGAFSARPSEPRVPPIPVADRTPEQAAMIARRSEINIYRTLAHHVDLYDRWSPLGRIILDNTTIPPRHREIVMLRMGWLCQSEYEFAQHARIATGPAVGMTAEEIDRIAAGPDAPGWTPFERTLLAMVDELRYEAMISDATWAALAEQYTDEQIVTAIFVAGQYQLVSMVLNSLGVQLDEGLALRLPAGHAAPPAAGRPRAPRLPGPRVPPLGTGADGAQPAAIADRGEGGEVLNLFATMARYPELTAAMNGFMTFLIGDGSSLSAQEREMLILRTAWNARAAYEWAHHVPAARLAGLSEAEIAAIADGPEAAPWDERRAALLAAADDLRAQAFVTDETWSALSAHYDTRQLMEIVFTVGGYAMAALAINSLGVQAEAGYPGFPAG